MKTLLDFWRHNPDRFKAALIDLDGTLYLSSDPIPGARNFVSFLKANNIPHLFLTNNEAQTPAVIASRIGKAGIEADENEIVTSTDPLAEALRQRGWEKKLFFLIGPEEIARRAGIRFLHDPDRAAACDALLFTGGSDDWKSFLTAAVRLLLAKPEIPVVTPNPDLLNPVRDGFMICSAGRFLMVEEILRRQTGKNLNVLRLGKPHSPIYECAFRKLGITTPAGRAAVAGIGDNLYSDVAGANAAGAASVLVLTGITTAEMAASAPPENRPQYVFDALAPEDGSR